LRKQRILIADDNPDMAFLVKRCFDGEEYQFIEARTGVEALENIEMKRPDLVLLDLKMPVKNGMEVLRELRNNVSTKDLPIIVLTVMNDTVEKVKALENGANDYLIKPPESLELKARVKTQLKLSQATNRIKEYSKQLEKIVDKKTSEIKKYANKLEDMVEEKVGVIRKQNEKILFNLKSAQKIQNSLLHVNFPGIKGIEFFAEYIPCETVSGDIYDVFKIDEDNLGIIIADVSGHGIPSAMITIYIKQIITYYCKDIVENGNYKIIRPKDVLNRLNDIIIDKNICEGKYFITMFYCIYSISHKTLVCSSAGHHALPIIKRNNGSFEVIRIEGFPLGWFKDSDDYVEIGYKLQSGDSILFYTDGILEILPYSKSGKYLDSVEALFSELLEKKNINKEIDRIKNNRKLSDDITLLLMKIKNHPNGHPIY